MVTVINPGGTFASQFGSGIGKGLSEQLPKEIKNYRLSSGIEKLRELGNVPPLEKVQHLLESGASMEDIQSLIPFLQQAQGTQALKNRAAGSTEIDEQRGAPSVQPLGTSEQLPKKEGYVAGGKGGFASKKQLDELRNSFVQKPSQAQIDQLAGQYIDEGISYDVNDARAKARDEIEQNRSSQQQALAKFEDDLSKRLTTELQGGGIGEYKDVTGEIQRKLLDEGIHRALAQGKTPVSYTHLTLPTKRIV